MPRSAKLEIITGVFLLLGVGAACGLVVLLSLYPGFLNPSYNLIARFPDASSLHKGSDVALSGALIGKVTMDPRPIAGTQMVEIHLRINQSVRLRKDARYTIASSGILGDKFITVSPRQAGPDEAKAPYAEDGDIVQGSETPDLTALITAVLPLIRTASHAVGELDDIVTRLNSDVLSPANDGNLKAIFKQLPDMVDAGGNVASTATALSSQLKSGDGALGKIWQDRQVRKDLADFIANYRAHGAIFYSDDTAPSPPPLPVRPTWRGRR